MIPDYSPVRGLPKLPLVERIRVPQDKELSSFVRALSAIKNATMRDFYPLSILIGEQARFKAARD